jgi:hypothetical protein
MPGFLGISNGPSRPPRFDGRRRRRRRHENVSRRDLLRLGASLAGVAVAGRFTSACDGQPPDTCLSRPVADRPLPDSEDWITGARVAGLSLPSDSTVCDVRPTLDAFAASKVSVVEIDPDLSMYLSDDDFAANVAVLDLVARECHARGLRAVAYYPVLEVLSPNAAQGAPAMSKDHPDWVQIFSNGMPNTFIGTGTGLVFWVDPGEESAWMCPTSGYVAYFLGRVEQLVRGTALDGLWADVPLLSDISTEGTWPCLNATCRQKFAADNPGFQLPTPIPATWPSFDDPTFRRWVIWRHKLIHDVEQQIVARAQAARPGFQVIVETVTMDYNGATLQGLDGAAFDDGALTRVWEVDAVSDASAMRSAAPKDWLGMALMMKFARAASAPGPAWAICYGQQESDAECVMSLAIAAGCAPYESKIPVLEDTVGAAYRARMFGWLADHPEVLAAPRSHPVAVLYSSTSRDALASYGDMGTGLYETTRLPAGQDPNNWWSTDSADATSLATYVCELRGMGAALIGARVPFDYLTTPHADAAGLAGYAAVIAPSPASLSPGLVATLVEYVRQGGTLVVTGPDAGAYDDLGAAQSAPALLAELGLLPPPATWHTQAVGAGRVLFTPARAGMDSFIGNADLSPLLAVMPAPRVIVDAPDTATLLVELRSNAAGDVLVLVANLTGLGGLPGQFTPQPVTFEASLESGGKQVTVTVSSPDGSGDVSVPVAAASPTQVKFSVTVNALTLARVQFA